MKQNEFIFHTSKIYFLAFTVIPKVYSQFLTCRFFQVLGRNQNREWLGRKAGTQKQRLQFEGGNGVVTTSPLEQQKFWSQSFTIAHEEMSLRTKTTQRHETSFNITLQSILWLMIHTWINFLLYLQAFHWHATSAKIAKKMSHTYEIICDSVQIQHTLVV